MIIEMGLDLQDEKMLYSNYWKGLEQCFIN